MSGGLYNSLRPRTFNVLNDFNRENLAIEIDTYSQPPAGASARSRARANEYPEISTTARNSALRPTD
jgi:predicted extracellular nuclease